MAMSKLSAEPTALKQERCIRLRPNPSSAPTYVRRGISGGRVTAAPPSGLITPAPGTVFSLVPRDRRSQRSSFTNTNLSFTVPTVFHRSLCSGLRLSSAIVAPNRRIVAHQFISPRRRQTSLAIVVVDPGLAMVPFKLNPDFGPNSCRLPVLPVIRDPRIAQQVFTHRSVAQRLTHVFEDHPDDPSPDNEKYEHLGDSVLGLVVTNMMFELYPGLRVGPSTKIRSLVVSNNTLADISKRYKLPDRLRLHQAQALTLRASTHIQADVFEAFIGGLFRDQGLLAVQNWLRPLFEPFAREAYRIVLAQHSLPPLPPSIAHAPPSSSSSDESGSSGSDHAAGNADWRGHGTPSIGHLALFNQLVAKMNKKLEWVQSDGNEPIAPIPLPAPGASQQDQGTALAAADPETVVVAGESQPRSQATSGSSQRQQQQWYADPRVPSAHLIKGTHSTPVWYVKVLVDGEFYGRGRGNTKKAAKNEAAKEGLIKLGHEV